MLRPSLLILLLIGLPAAARADITAHYVNGNEEALIEVDEDGSARMGGVGGKSYSLFTEKGDFVVFQQNGSPVAAPYADFHAALDELSAPMWAMMGGKPQPKPSIDFALREAGAERVAGFPGTRYEWDGNPADQSHAILSDDPDLRPLGPPMATLLRQMPSLQGALTGEKDPALAALADKLSSAALLSLGRAITLRNVDRADIPADRFALPAKVLTRAEVKTMLNRSEAE